MDLQPISHLAQSGGVFYPQLLRRSMSFLCICAVAFHLAACGGSVQPTTNPDSKSLTEQDSASAPTVHNMLTWSESDDKSQLLTLTGLASSPLEGVRVLSYCMTTTDNSKPKATASCFKEESKQQFWLTQDNTADYYVWVKDSQGRISDKPKVVKQSSRYLCSAADYELAKSSNLPTVCLVIEQQNGGAIGTIVIELESLLVSNTVTNFLKYVNDGFYTGTVFHRIMSTFMVQGGGFNFADDKFSQKQATYSTIDLESPTTTGLQNTAGTLAMARTSEPNSATSQFFINVVDNSSLNGSSSTDGYAVFGRVISGMQTTVATIKGLPVVANSLTGDGKETSQPTAPPIIVWAYQMSDGSK